MYCSDKETVMYGQHKCNKVNEYHIEWFGLQGSQTGLHSVIEVYNMNEQKILV